MPPSQLFVNFIKAEWIAEKGSKTETVQENVFPSSMNGWQYRKKITVQENAGQNLTDYQVKLTVHYGSGSDSGLDIYLDQKCRSDFGDIRFTKDDGETLLDYWMEEKVDSDYAIFWIEVPNIPANGTADIYIYYGNSDAVYDGDGAQVFDVFDDFSTDTLSQYVLIDDCWYIENGLLKRDSSTPKGGFISKSKSLERKYALRAKIYVGSSDAGIGFIWGSAGGGEGSVSGYIANYYSDSQYSKLRRYESGSSTGIADLPTNVSGWQVIEIRVTSDKVIVVRNGVEDANAVDTTFSTLNGIGFREKAANVDAVDWWALRKYVEPEPSISGIGSEEYYLQEITTTIQAGEVSAQFLNADGESLGQVYDAYDTQFYTFRKWPQGYGSFTYRNSGDWGSNGASVSDKRMGILHAYCLKLAPDTLGSDGEIYYPSTQDLNLDLSWVKWLRLYLYADHENDVTIKIRLHQDASNYFEGSLVVKSKEWRKYEISMDSLSQVGSPSLSNINWISIISLYPILMDSDHVFLPAVRELMRARFTLKRDSPDDPSPKLKLVKIIWREGA